VQRIPIPPWAFYTALATVFILLHAAVKWIDGSFPAGEFVGRIMLADVSFIYALGLLHYLDIWALEALDDFRPCMHIDEREYQDLRYRFTTLPQLPTVIAALVGTIYGLYSLLVIGEGQRQAGRFFSSVPATVLESLFFVLTYLGAGVAIYHSVRQLRMVSLIYTKYTHVDLFNLTPIYALASLAGRTSVGVLLITYAWFFVNISLDLGPTSSLDIVVLSSVSVITFLLPLWGAHRLLVEAKTKAQTTAQQQFKATVEELHERRDAAQYGEMAGINDALDGLLKEQSVLDKISVWPWRPETLRGVVTAVLLPVLVWAVTRLLERFWTF
jgi:hypothetical protein